MTRSQRLQPILAAAGVEYEFLYDYGMGAVKVASFASDGSYELL